MADWPEDGTYLRVDTVSTGIPGTNGSTHMTISDPKTGCVVSGSVEHKTGGRLVKYLQRQLMAELRAEIESRERLAGAQDPQ